MLSSEKTLVQDLIVGEEIQLERVLLTISGLETEQDIQEYLKKLDVIETWFNMHYRSNGTQYNVARSLFDFLWETNPDREFEDDNFLLTDAIDAHLSPGGAMSDCLGLTSIYTVLGLRQGLDLLLHDSGEHITSLLKLKRRKIEIEHTEADGFDCMRNLYHRIFGRILPTSHLIAFTLNSRGVTKSNNGDPRGAIEDYDMVLKLDPGDYFTYVNRGVAKQNMGNHEGAEQDYQNALQLDPNIPEVYFNLGDLRLEQNKLEEARLCFCRALEIDPKFTKILADRGITRADLGYK